MDKIVAYQPSSNKVVNADQLHEEEMEQHFLEALAAGRVRFVSDNSLSGLDIRNMGKVTIH